MPAYSSYRVALYSSSLRAAAAAADVCMASLTAAVLWPGLAVAQLPNPSTGAWLDHSAHELCNHCV